jgi:hypothetical protein
MASIGLAIGRRDLEATFREAFRATGTITS